MNIAFVVLYREIKTEVYFQYDQFIRFDMVWVIIWDAIVLFCSTTIRIFGVLRLPELHSLFQDIVTLFKYCLHTSIASERDVVIKLKRVDSLAKKWIIFVTVLGSIHCLCYTFLYIVGFESQGREGFFITCLNIYMEVMLTLHNSNALFMNYLLQLISFGFEMVTTKLISKGIPMFIAPVARISKEKGRDSYIEHTSTVQLQVIFDVVKRVEGMIETFNDLFSPGLLVESILSFCQVIFSAYYLHTDPRMGKSALWAITFLIPIILYPMSLISLCYFSNNLTRKCNDMLVALEDFPLSTLSTDDYRKLQLMASRLHAHPPRIHVLRLFNLKESLLCSILNALATYMVVLIQMREIHKN